MLFLLQVHPDCSLILTLFKNESYSRSYYAKRSNQIVANQELTYFLGKHGLLDKTLLEELLCQNLSLDLYKKLLSFIPKDSYPLFSRYREVFIQDRDQLNLLHFIKTMNQLNPNLIHDHIANKLSYSEDHLEIFQLFSATGLLNQANYDLLVARLPMNEELFKRLINVCPKEHYHLLNTNLEQIIYHSAPLTLFNFIQTLYQLNPSLLHKSISNQIDFETSLKLCKLFNAVDLLNQKHYEVILTVHQIKPKGVFKTIRFDYVLELLQETMTPNERYVALFELAKQRGFVDKDFSALVDAYKESSPMEILETSLLTIDQSLDRRFMAQLLLKLNSVPNRKLLTWFNESVYSNQHPAFIKHFTQLSTIELFDGGHSGDNWWKLTAQFLQRLEVPVYKDHCFLSLSETIKLPDEKQLVRLIKSEIDQGYWTFLRLQGRTILLKNKAKNVLSIKVQKKDESIEALKREYKVTSLIKSKAKKLGLLGNFVNPMGLVKLSAGFIKKIIGLEHRQLLTTEFYNLTEVKEPNFYSAYLYKTKKKSRDYHTYLHDKSLSEAQFSKSNQIVVTNLSKLLGQGVIFDRLSDLFHNVISTLSPNPNRPDLGRYIVLANLLAPTQFRSGPERYGSGRVTAWQKAVQYPNLRLNQLADLGDCITMKDILVKGDWHERYFYFLKLEYGPKASNYILYNFIAEYLYVLLLIAGLRGYSLTQNKDLENPFLVWQSLAKQVFDNCVTMAFQLSHKTNDEIRDALSKVCNLNTLARQMQFWMTSEYVKQVQNNLIPTEVYGQQVNVKIDFERFRRGTFRKDLGCSINGVDRDLGTVNGQEPIKEANKLLYWTVTLIAASSLELDLILKEVLFLFANTDYEKNEPLRKQAFAYLPTPSKEKILAEVCKRQAQKTMGSEDAALYEKAAKTHEQFYAARTVQYFWRKRLLKNQEDNIDSQSLIL